jgi:hypothetical protein
VSLQAQSPLDGLAYGGLVVHHQDAHHRHLR